MNLKQVWFPGYHADVGGHSTGSIDTNSVDEIAFSWMCDQVFGLLQLSMSVLSKYILFRLGDNEMTAPGKDKKIRNLDASWRKVEWSNGTLEDNNGWLSGWWVPSLVSTAKASYYRVPGETKAYEMVGKKQQQIDYRQFNEEIHPCVQRRVEDTKNNAKTKYTPAPFRKGWEYVAPTKTERGHWKKKVAGGKDVILYEYTIPELKPFHESEAEIEHWKWSLERAMAPADVIAAQKPFVQRSSE